jgi:tRNA dimethylallyltransferase
METKVAAIVGPTAVGKSAIAIDVAERLGAEIVSVDSIQIYRGLDIGAAKPPSELLRRIPHHLLDELDPTQELNVADFQGRARRAVSEIAGRGRLPLLVGGSGLYFRAVVDDLDFPPRVPAVRARLEEEGRRQGPETLYHRLRALDPSAAQRMEPANLRRIVRALEVIEITGRPFSEADRWNDYRPIYDLAVAGLRLPRIDLHRRIADRVDDMLAEGLVGEARDLEQKGIGSTARQALGYRQVLEAPEADPDEIRARIVSATRRYARRQESWFRGDPRVTWFDAELPGLVAALVDHFRALLALP